MFARGAISIFHTTVYLMRFFCLSRKHVFTLELLDSWLWDICGTGGAFRDVFSSWESKTYCTSGSFHRLGTESNVTQQRGNEAFPAFLKNLKFVKDEDLYDLFYARIVNIILQTEQER